MVLQNVNQMSIPLIPMERKTCWIGVKATSAKGAGNRLSGYASIKNEADAVGDVVLDGAYGDIQEFVRTGFVAVGHDHSAPPVGFVTEAREDSKGLFVTMEFHSTQPAQEAKTVALERLAAGKQVGLSIGYLPVDWSFENRGGQRVRLLKAIELKEFSLVSLPAAKGAAIMQTAPDEDVLGLARAWQQHQGKLD